MKAIIIGKSGQLAKELISEKSASVEVIALGRNDVDISNLSNLKAKLNSFSPDVIINSSAYTAVDLAESNIEDAYKINELAVENIAKVAEELNSKLIHVSTDFVFDGNSLVAYKPEDNTSPCNVYGKTKLAGELALNKIYPENSSTIRTSWLYSEFGNNFVKTMLKLMNERESLNVVSDQIGSPTCAKGLAKFIWLLVNTNSLSNIYHWSDSGIATWYDFAVAIQDIAYRKKILGRKIPINPIASQEYPTPAIRPKFSLLNCEKSHDILMGEHWTHKLEKCLGRIQCSE